jgi:hypothetical protein
VLTTPIAPVSGPAQTIHPGTDVEAQWWHRFGSKAMDDLVTRALAANTDIAQAEAALRQSRDLAGAARGFCSRKSTPGTAMNASGCRATCRRLSLIPIRRSSRSTPRK